MSGNFQLMQYTPSVEDHFEIDEEIVCWKNKKQLYEKIEYYLENESEREKIAKKGFKRAIENYTWSKRIEHIGSIIEYRRKFNLTNYVIQLKELLNNDYFLKIKNSEPSNIHKRNYELINFVLSECGYKIKKDLIFKRKFKFHGPNFIYKPKLKGFYFIKIKNKIMMIIKIIPVDKKLDYEDWQNLEKTLCITENIDLSLPQFKSVFDLEYIDLSLPQFGILTNGYEWIIKDFKNRKWLKSIPSKKALKSYINLKKYNLIKLKSFFYKNEKHLRFLEKIPDSIKKSIFNLISNFT